MHVRLLISTLLCCGSRIYFNNWALANSKDGDRTEDMLYEETTLALDLHFVQLEQSRKEAGNWGWVSGYLAELRNLLEEEAKASSRLRRRALDLGNPPPYMVRLHRHRRHLACIEQEIDLIEQAVTGDANGETITDPCVYLKHAIQSGSAIITGAQCVLSCPLYRVSQALTYEPLKGST